MLFECWTIACASGKIGSSLTGRCGSVRTNAKQQRIMDRGIENVVWDGGNNGSRAGVTARQRKGVVLARWWSRISFQARVHLPRAKPLPESTATRYDDPLTRHLLSYLHSDENTPVWKDREWWSSRVQIKDSGLTLGVDNKTSLYLLSKSLIRDSGVQVCAGSFLEQ